MAVDSSLPVGSTGESLETVKTGANVHREGVFIGDPVVDAARVAVSKTIPDGTGYGLNAYVMGNVVVTASALPAGAATGVKQDTGNTTLASIDAHLAGTLAVLGSVAVTNFPATQPVSIAATVAVSGPLTDVQLRATPVPISGTVTANAGTNLNTSTLNVEATQALIKAKTDNLDVALSTRLKPADTLAAVTNLAQLGGVAIAMGTGARSAGTQRVTVATDDVVPVTNANLDVALSTRLKPADTLAGVTTVTAVTAITNALPAGTNLLGKVGIDQTTPGTTNAVSANQGTGAAAGTSWRTKGDQARGSATIADPVILGGRATDYPASVPTAVAAGQVVDIALDLKGVQVVRPRQVPTFVTVYRLALAAASSSLAFTFVANTDKQLATIYHTAAATKRKTIRRIWVQILKTGAVAGELQLELRQLSATTAPATGNPAITPGKRDSSSAAAEATCLALPTTAGSEVASNSPIASCILNLAASVGTASGTGLLPPDPMWIKLYDEASADDEEVAPIMRAGVAEGWAVIGRSTAAIPLNFIVRVVHSEE